MTQRIFDVDNEKDMADLWDILPDDAVRISVVNKSEDIIYIEFEEDETMSALFKVNWHDKTEITRPIQEATEDDVGKLCRFWRGNETCCHYGILFGIDKDCSKGKYMMSYSDKYSHCRRLTKTEISELC